MTDFKNTDNDVLAKMAHELERANNLKEAELKKEEDEKKSKQALEDFQQQFPKYRSLLDMIDSTAKVKKDASTDEMHARLQDLDKSLPAALKKIVKASDPYIQYAQDTSQAQNPQGGPPAWEKYVVPVTDGPDTGSALQIIKQTNPATGESGLHVNVTDNSKITHTLADTVMKTRQSLGISSAKIPKSLQWNEQLNLYAAAVHNGMSIEKGSYIPKSNKEMRLIHSKIDELRENDTLSNNLNEHNMAELDNDLREIKNALVPDGLSRRDAKAMDQILDADENSPQELQDRKEAIHLHGQLLSKLGYELWPNGKIRFKEVSISDSRKENIRSALRDFQNGLKEGRIDNTQLRNALRHAGGDEHTPSLTMNKLKADQEKRHQPLMQKIVSRFFNGNDNKAPAAKQSHNPAPAAGISGPVRGLPKPPPRLMAPKPPGQK